MSRIFLIASIANIIVILTSNLLDELAVKFQKWFLFTGKDSKCTIRDI